jgi:hypothetical protein
VNVSVWALVTVLERFPKVVDPEIVCAEPSNTTVPLLCVNVAPVRAKLPATVVVVGAENVPDVRVRSPFMSRLLAEVKVSVAPSVAFMVRLLNVVAHDDIAWLSAAESPSPINRTVPASVYPPPAELVLVVVLLVMVPALIKVPSIFAANVPVPTVVIPAVVKLKALFEALFVSEMVALSPSGYVVSGYVAPIFKFFVPAVVAVLLIVMTLKIFDAASTLCVLVFAALPSSERVTFDGTLVCS